jgi:hypothetical protein
MATYEHSVHELVTIRLLDAPPGMLRNIEGVLGPPVGPGGEP